MRREQCEITDPSEMMRLLNSATIGRMATIDDQGYPYITPVNFVIVFMNTNPPFAVAAR